MKDRKLRKELIELGVLSDKEHFTNYAVKVGHLESEFNKMTKALRKVQVLLMSVLKKK